MLTDASALIAFFNSHDNNHEAATGAVARYPHEIFITTLPCFAETTRQVSGKNPQQQDLRIYDHLEKELIQIHLPTQTEVLRAAALVKKYDDRPMSFTAASLIAAAEALNQRRIFTYDSDFYFYQINDRHPVEVIK